MDGSVLGINLGKNSCSVVGLGGAGKVVVRRRMQRETVISFAASLAPCVVAMEGLLRCPSYGPCASSAWTYRPVDVAEYVRL